MAKYRIEYYDDNLGSNQVSYIESPSYRNAIIDFRELVGNYKIEELSKVIDIERIKNNDKRKPKKS